MKAVRIWLLVLLAALLPLRGAVAAAMLCPGGSSGTQNELRMHEHAASHAAVDHGMAHDHAQHQHDGADHQHDHAKQPHGMADAGHHEDSQGHGTPDKCNMCSACCSLTPLVSEVPTLPEPGDATVLRFPDLSSPAPTFQSDGQERPPRSI